MQTFLPYPSFDESAKVLDYRRLGKQRSETLQILKTLKYGSRWKNHPAVLMWKGYENSLVIYGLSICTEWKRRGYKDTCYEKIKVFINNMKSFKSPPWLGNKEFHLSHQSNLIRKKPEFYSHIFNVEKNLPYIWPTKQKI